MRSSIRPLSWNARNEHTRSQATAPARFRAFPRISAPWRFAAADDRIKKPSAAASPESWTLPAILAGGTANPATSFGSGSCDARATAMQWPYAPMENVPSRCSRPARPVVRCSTAPIPILDAVFVFVCRGAAGSQRARRHSLVPNVHVVNVPAMDRSPRSAASMQSALYLRIGARRRIPSRIRSVVIICAPADCVMWKQDADDLGCRESRLYVRFPGRSKCSRSAQDACIPQI